jgi:hypothetical protein
VLRYERLRDREERVREKKESGKLRPYFIMGGLALGLVLSLWYLWLNYAGRSITGTPTPPDPVWTRFVNVMLIIFAATFQGSLLGRLCDKAVARIRGRKGK